MNEALVTLMLITTTGFYPGPQFGTFEECEAISDELTEFTTFCHYKEPVNILEYSDQLSQFLKEFRNQIDREDSSNFGKPEVDL